MRNHLSAAGLAGLAASATLAAAAEAEAPPTPPAPPAPPARGGKPAWSPADVVPSVPIPPSTRRSAPPLDAAQRRSRADLIARGLIEACLTGRDPQAVAQALNARGWPHLIVLEATAARIEMVARPDLAQPRDTFALEAERSPAGFDLSCFARYGSYDAAEMVQALTARLGRPVRSSEGWIWTRRSQDGATVTDVTVSVAKPGWGPSVDVSSHVHRPK